MRRVRLSVALPFAIAVAALVLVATATALQDAFRREAIARFLESRRAFDIRCLYTFDRLQSAINVSAPLAYNASRQDAADDHLLVTIPPTIEEHVGADCPFGDLQFDPELVTRLNDTQLGVHLSEDPNRDVKRPQIASNDVVPAKEFFSWATKHGISFEFSYRRRVATNQTMTLFSISNRYGSCVDPGFRVDLIKTHVIMLIYFFPVLVGNDIACYERRLFSARIDPCVMPYFRPNIDDNPVVHVVVTIDATGGEGALRSEFFLKYVDPVTMDTFECRGIDAMEAPEETIDYEYIQGTYRLYIGNNPRNVSTPLLRTRIASVRPYRDPTWDDRPAEEILRSVIEQKLNALEGPRLPASFRLFGGKGLSMSILNIPLPAVSEDTPFKWARNTIDDLKKKHGEDIVNFIIKSLQERQNSSKFGGTLTDEADSDPGDKKSILDDDYDSTFRSHQGIYPNANGSTFDVFHFAVYYKPVSADDAKNVFWHSGMTPYRPFMELKRAVRIREDEQALLEMLQLHSVFDDVNLEIVQLPERGTILLYPNKSALTSANVKYFHELPMEQQQRLYFVPNPGESGMTIKPRNLSLQKEPYATIRFRVWNSETGRNINTTREGVIEIWVDPDDNGLQQKAEVLNMDAYENIPLYVDLDVVDRTHPTSYDEGALIGPQGSRKLGLFDGLDALGLNTTQPASEQSSTSHEERVRIISIPRYGRLYDRKMENASVPLQSTDVIDPNELEPYRIRRQSIGNRTFSPALVLLYVAQYVEPEGDAMDLLEYQLQAKLSAPHSPQSTIQFHLHRHLQTQEITRVGVYTVDEDSAVTIALLDDETSDNGYASRIQLEELPRHGKLFQYHPAVSESSRAYNASLGTLIHSPGVHVDDARGRVVYVPNPDYFNSIPYEEQGFGRQSEILDSFNYSIISQPSLPNSFGIRSVDLRVMSTHDPLSFLPPTIILTNNSRGEPVHVPVIFDDTDNFTGTFRVTIEAQDGVSAIEFGHVVTDDDVLKYCPIKRPCNLVRSANESYISNANGDNDETAEWKLRYFVKTRTWNPSKIDVQGSRVALQYSLQRLVFRDMTKWTWFTDHTARFRVTIERSDYTIKTKAEMVYYIQFSSVYVGEDSDSLGQALSNLTDLVSMGLWIIVIGFILSSASCCSMGFCCCCSRARKEKRQRFERAHDIYINQVAQNNHEYSALLMVLDSIICDPDLDFVTVFLRTCGDSHRSERSVLQALSLKSMIPVLDKEGLFFNFVAHLMTTEHNERPHANLNDIFAYPSLASIALAQFCVQKGDEWLCNLRSVLSAKEIAQHDDTPLRLIQTIEETLRELPNEIVLVCQKCVELHAGSDSATDQVAAIHIVFLNHFIGPWLWFMKRDSRGKRLHRSQQMKLRESVRLLASYGWVSSPTNLRPDAARKVLDRYALVLQRISAHSITRAVFDSPKADPDVIGACLMNLHSILERVLPAVEIEEKAEDQEQMDPDQMIQEDEDVSGELDIGVVAEIRGLLHALNFPLTCCEALITCSESELKRDPLLWSGLSINDWRTRCEEATKRGNHQPTREPQKLHHSESLLAVDITEEEARDTSTNFESSRSHPTFDYTPRIEFEF